MYTEHQVQNEFGHCFYTMLGDHGFVWNLYIYPEHRRKGKARELLECVKKILNKEGYSTIKMYAVPTENSIERVELVRFYESMGFHVLEES